MQRCQMTGRAFEEEPFDGPMAYGTKCSECGEILFVEAKDEP